MGNEEEKESLQNEKKMEIQAAWKKEGMIFQMRTGAGEDIEKNWMRKTLYSQESKKKCMDVCWALMDYFVKVEAWLLSGQKGCEHTHGKNKNQKIWYSQGLWIKLNFIF